MKNCIGCNETISEERLEALPGVEFCVKCASQINPRRAFAKGSPGEALFDEMMEGEEVDTTSAVPAWNERNPDISINSDDEQLLKEAI